MLAHAGNPWIESAAEVAYKNPNVVIDGSAFLIGDLAAMPPGDRRDLRSSQPVRWIFGYVDDPTKLMFGTDWPLVRIGPYLEAFKRAIPREHWQAVFHDNAARVYGFDMQRDRNAMSEADDPGRSVSASLVVFSRSPAAVGSRRSAGACPRTTAR